MTHNRYHEEIYLSIPLGPNVTDFEARKKKSAGPDHVGYGILRIPPMIIGSLDDVRINDTGYAYEMLDNRITGGIKRERGLESLIEIIPSLRGEGLGVRYFIIDNHHHAFYCRYKAYHDGILPRGSHLIHIDQHSDLGIPPVLGGVGEGKNNIITSNSSLQQVATYTNEVLDIGSFILPALDSGIISGQTQVRTEHSLLQFSSLHGQERVGWVCPTHQTTKIINIDLDFRAPEMSIEHYSQTIKKVRQIIASPEVKCITIATSPAFIDQDRALEILRDILE